MFDVRREPAMRTRVPASNFSLHQTVRNDTTRAAASSVWNHIAGDLVLLSTGVSKIVKLRRKNGSPGKIGT